MKTPCLSILCLLLAAGCQSEPQVEPTSAPLVSLTATQSVQPLWLDAPPATPAVVIATITWDGNPDEGNIAIFKAAEQLKADAILPEAPANLIRPDLNEGFLPTTISRSSNRHLATRQRFFLLSFVGPSPFVTAYFDEAAQAVRTISNPSLFRFEPGVAYSTYGRYVISPYAPTKPPVCVIGQAPGAKVVCPYSNKTFDLW